MSEYQDKSVHAERRDRASIVRIEKIGIENARYSNIRAAALAKQIPSLTDLSLAERLVFAWLVLVYDYEDEEIERLIGRSVKQFWRYIEGQDIPLSVLLRISEVSEIPESYLILGLFPGRDASSTDGIVPEIAMIPRLSFRASAGAGSFVLDHEETMVPVPRRLLQQLGLSERRARLLESHGDSMLPTIASEDPLIIEKDAEYIDGRIYVFTIGNEVYVKRLRRGPGHLVMISDNPEWPTREEAIPNEGFNLIGRVRWVGRTL